MSLPRLLDDLRAVEPRAQRADAGLEQPCSFFAAWYSKFSERSPNSRAFLIAATTSTRRGPSSSASSSRSASACFSVKLLAVYHFDPPPAARGVDEPRPGDLHARRLVVLDSAVQTRDAADVGLLLRQDERDAGAATTGPAGAADAVRVRVRLFGRIVVDHVGDVLDVEPARGDVGGDEGAHLARVELRERPLALGLPLVAVDRDRVDVVAAQLLDEPVGTGLGAHEDEREPAFVLVEQVDERLHLRI